MRSGAIHFQSESETKHLSPRNRMFLQQDNQLTTSTFSQMLAQGKGYGAAMLFISKSPP